MLRKILLVMLAFSVTFFSYREYTPKASANPVVVGAGVEAGVGAYVLAVLALAAGLEMAGVTNGSDAVKKHAYGVWDTTQSLVGAAWNVGVTASSSLASSMSDPWILSIGKEIYDKLVPGYNGNPDLRYDFLTAVTIAKVTSVSDQVQFGFNAWEDDRTDFFVSGPSFVMVYKGRLVERVYYYYNGVVKATMIGGGTLTGTSSSFKYESIPWGTGTDAYQGAKAALWLAAKSDTLVYYSPSAILDPVVNDLLPKVAADYKVRIPALDDFKPYPKTKTGLPDVSIGPLVVNPADSKTFKNETTGKVYTPDQVAWDFPKPQVKVNEKTGAKEIGFTDTKTGTWEKATDITGADTGTSNPPVDDSSINFEPLRALPVTTTFPFSLPWDLQRLINLMVATPVAPKLPYKMFGAEGYIEMPQMVTDNIPLVRSGIIITFVLGLVFATRKLLGGGQ